MRAYTHEQCQEMIDALGRTLSRESELADLLHEVMLSYNREAAKVAKDGIDRCRSCDADMEVSIPLQNHAKMCEIGDILKKANAYFMNDDRINDVSRWLQAREYAALT